MPLAEIIGTVAEGAKKVVEVSAKVVKETAKKAGDTASKMASGDTKFNPDARLKVDKINPSSTISNKFNPDKRIENSSDVHKLVKQYVKEMKELAEYPETLKDLKNLKVEDFQRISPEEVAEKRRDFKSRKNSIIKEWETINQRQWPTYEEDVLGPDDVVIRKKGDRKDAHHKKPLCFGGDNTGENITPMDLKKHNQLHQQSFKTLTEKIK